ncbi:hypothetical protein [Methylomonas sp. MgM2]
MITSRNTSLAAQTIGFARPYSAGISNQSITLPTANEQNNNKQESNPSTPEQIQAAISQTGLSKENHFIQEGDRRVNQALQAYNQIRNASQQTQLENIIVRVDYYA